MQRSIRSHYSPTHLLGDVRRTRLCLTINSFSAQPKICWGYALAIPKGNRNTRKHKAFLTAHLGQARLLATHPT